MAFEKVVALESTTAPFKQKAFKKTACLAELV